MQFPMVSMQGNVPPYWLPLRPHSLGDPALPGLTSTYLYLEFLVDNYPAIHKKCLMRLSSLLLEVTDVAKNVAGESCGGVGNEQVGVCLAFAANWFH